MTDAVDRAHGRRAEEQQRRRLRNVAAASAAAASAAATAAAAAKVRGRIGGEDRIQAAAAVRINRIPSADIALIE